MAGSLARLKGEISAAVALGGGALLATGYGITAARLYNVGVPLIPVLSALPDLYYLGEAIQALVVPLFAALTAGTIWIIRYGDGWKDEGKTHQRPAALGLFELSSWSGLALILTLYSWLVVFVSRGFALHGAEALYLFVTLIIVVGMSILAKVLDMASFRPVSKHATAGDDKQARDRRVRAVLCVVVISILGASLIRICNAFFLSSPLPAAVVSANPENCTFLHPEINTGHCYFRGYYLGESGQWVFLVWKPSKEEEEAAPGISNRLILIPRADVLQILVAEKLDSLPQVNRG